MRAKLIQQVIQKVILIQALFIIVVFEGCRPGSREELNNNYITIENADMRFVLNADGTAHSLVHKATGEECLLSAKASLRSDWTHRCDDCSCQLPDPAPSLCSVEAD